MKTILKFSILLLSLIFTLSSCMDETPDKPVLIEPHYAGAARTHSIKQLKAMYTGTLKQIDSAVVISGVIVANDESGNIYKALFIQDETAGIKINLNKTSLNNTYKVGQRIYINCKALYLGEDDGVVQLGDLYNNGVGQLSEIKIKDYLFLDGFPKAENTPAAKIITSSAQCNDSLVNCLVTLQNVSFVDDGQVYSTSDKSTSRTINFEGGTTIVAYNSSYASFQASILPSGSGNVTGILSKYGSTWQILIRSIDDVSGFVVVPLTGDGSKTNAYTVNDAKKQQGETTKWVKGYIVGVFETVGDKSDIPNFGPSFTIQSNILIAASPTETDANKCIPVKLTQGDVRTALNLNANISNLGKEVLIYGDLATGFGKPAIINTSAYWWVESNTGIEPIPPAPNSTYTLSSTISDGTYIFAANVSNVYKVATPLESSKTYGYLTVTDASISNNMITISESNEFTVTASTNGFTIKDSNGRYLYMTGTFTSVNVSATLPTSGAEWTFTKNPDGTFAIKNISMNKSIQYSINFKSYGSYSTNTDIMPFVFKKN